MRIALALALVALGIAAHAQGAVPGDLVRISAPSLGRHESIVTLVAATPESLTVATRAVKPDTSTVAAAAITSLRFNHAGETHGHAGAGFVIGGVSGAVLGMAAIATENEIDCAIVAMFGSTTCAKRSVAGGALAGAAIGGGIGALIGLAIRTRTWTRQEPGAIGSPPRVGVVPTWQPAQHRFGVAAQIRF